MKFDNSKGYTLVELLVAITVIAVLVGVLIFTLQSSRSAARDGRRKADLAYMQSGFEELYTDCRSYYSTSAINDRFPGGSQAGSPIIGISSLPSPCLASNTYLESLPSDPLYPPRQYRYNSTSEFDAGLGVNVVREYYLCAALETALTPAMDVTNCGGQCGNVACNYIVGSSHSIE